MKNLSRTLLGICLVAMLLLPTSLVGSASAGPGAYRIVIVHAICEPPTELQAGLAAFPDVAAVDIFDGCAGTPTAQQLLAYDLVVSMSDSQYANQEAYGNALADFVDGGGVVAQFAYDNWDGSIPGETNGPTGRFLSGGYAPFLPGDNPNELVTLGTFDASSPLMQGVAALSAELNTTPELAPGAVLVAKWSDGSNLIAVKGRVVSVSANLDDEGGWGGDFPRLILNAIRSLGPQTLTVENPAPGMGSVASSPAGIACQAFACIAHFPLGTQVALTPSAVKGFAFSGFTGSCAGASCALTMDGAKKVIVEFVRFAPIGKLKRNKRTGRALLTVRAGGPGKLTLTGKRVKRQTKAVAAAANLKIPIVAKGKAAKKLKKSGKAKVGVKVTFTPANGLPASFSRAIGLRLEGVRP